MPKHFLRRGLILVAIALARNAPAREPATFLLLDAGGQPVAGARVSVLGRTGSVLTTEGGAFRLDPEPTPPFELAVFSGSGAWLGIVRVERVSPGASPVALRLPSHTSAEVTVEADAAPSTIAPPADAGTLVTAQEIEERRPSTLTTAIEEVPGAWRSDETSSAVPTIRGLSAGRVLLLLDDGRISAERRAGASGSFLDPSSLEAVEVVRGPGSVAYGSDAIGGVIHARTPLPEPGRLGGRYAFRLGAGGAPETSGTLGLNVPLGAAALLVQAQQRAERDYETPGGTMDNSSSRGRGLLARALVPLGANRLWAGFQIDEVKGAGKPTADQLVQRTSYPLEESRRFTLGFDAPQVLGVSLEARAFLGSYRLVTNRERLPAGTTTRRLSSADVDADDASFRILARRAVGAGSLRAGLDLNGRFGLRAIGSTQSFDADDLPTTRVAEVSVDDASRTDMGVFAEGDMPLIEARLTLSAGLRGDTVRTRNTDGYFGDRSASHGSLSGFGALTWQLAPGWSASAQFARGFRDALLSDRYFRGISGRGFVVGNPDLSPEKTDQLDAALRGRLGPVGLAVFGYFYRVHDLIERHRAGDDFRFRNRGVEEIRGFELEADARFTPRLLVRGTAALSRGRILDDGSNAAGIPPLSFSLSVDHAMTDALWYRARVVIVAPDDDPGPTEVAVPGYARVDLSAGCRLSERFTVSVVARNLLDQEYADSADELHVTAPGRSALVVIGGRF